MEIRVTPAQSKVIPLVREGYSNQDIGKKLNLSARTVESHLSSLYMLANVQSRTQFINWLQFNSITIENISKERVKKRIELAHELKSQGCSVSQIAERMGICYGSVTRYLTKPNIKLSPVSIDIKRYTEFEVITSPPKIICWFWGA